MMADQPAMAQGYRGVFTVAKEEQKSKDPLCAGFGWQRKNPLPSFAR